MSWPKKIATLSLLSVISGCGVKGDPLPPEKPVELGRGRPTYTRATEEISRDKKKKTDDSNDQE